MRASVNYKLTDTIALTTVPELDVFGNALDDGRHVNTAQLINAGFALPGNFTLHSELWGDWNFDSAGAVTQNSNLHEERLPIICVRETICPRSRVTDSSSLGLFSIHL